MATLEQLRAWSNTTPVKKEPSFLDTIGDAYSRAQEATGRGIVSTAKQAFQYADEGSTDVGLGLAKVVKSAFGKGEASEGFKQAGQGVLKGAAAAVSGVLELPAVGLLSGVVGASGYEDEVASGFSSANDYIKGYAPEWLDESGKQAFSDVLLEVGTAGLAYGGVKVVGNTSKSVKNTISDSFKPKIEEPTVEGFRSLLEEKANTSGKKMTRYEIENSAKEYFGKSPNKTSDVFDSNLWNYDDSFVKNATERATELVANKQFLKTNDLESYTRKLIDENQITRKQATDAISEALNSNRKVIQDDLNSLKAVVSDDIDSSIKASSIVDLEEKGLLKFGGATKDGDLYFSYSDKARKLNQEGGTGIIKIKESDYTNTKERLITPEDNAIKTIVDDIDKAPQLVEKLKQGIDGNVDITNDSLVKRIDDMLFEEQLGGVNKEKLLADSEILATRLGKEVDDIKTNGNLDIDKIKNLIEEAKSTSRKTPLDSTLSGFQKELNKYGNDFRRTSIAAKKVALERVRNAKVNGASPDTIAKLTNDVRKSGSKTPLINFVEGLSRNKDIQWYGNSTDLSKLHRIINNTKVDSISSYNKVVNNVMTTIQETNKKFWKERIQKQLKNYFREQTAKSTSKKRLDTMYRMELEMVAKKMDDFTRTGDVDNLIQLSETIKLLQKEGRAKYADRKLNMIADAQKIADEAKSSVKSIDIDSKDPTFKDKIKSFAYDYVEDLRKIGKTVGGNLSNPLYKKMREVSHSHHSYNKFRDNFAENVAKKLVDMKLTSKADNEKLGHYFLLTQGDIDKVLTNDGRFIGKNVIDGIEFNSLDEVLNYKNSISKELNSIKGFPEFEKYIRKTIEDIYDINQAHNLIYNDAMSGVIKNYYPAKLKKDVFQALSYDNMESLFRNGEGFNEGFLKSREYGNPKTYTPDFLGDMNRFMDTQARRAYIQPAFEDARAILKQGALDNTNEYTQKLYRDFLINAAQGSRESSNLLTQMLSQISGTALAFRPTSVAKQYLTLGDSLVYVPLNNITKATTMLTKSSKLRNSITKASDVLSGAMLDNTFRELEKYSPSTKIGKGLKKYNEVGMQWLKANDAITKRIVWLGAYMDEAKRLGIDITPDMDFSQYDNLVQYADDITQRVAGSRDVLRTPNNLKTTLGKMFHMLGGVGINRAGLISLDVPAQLIDATARRRMEIIAGPLLSTILETAVNPAFKALVAGVIGYEGYDLLNEWIGGSEDERGEAAFLKLSQTIASQFPISREISNILMYDSSGSPIVDIIKSSVKSGKSFVKKLNEDDTEGAILDGLKGISKVIGGYPIQQYLDINKIVNE